MVEKKENETRIILFDGTCGFCNRSVQFIIRHGGEKKFVFVPLQSQEGKELLKRYQLPESYLKSLVLFENEKVYLKSGAALRIAARLNRPLRWTSAFIILPSFLRDLVYDWISKYRHSLPGNQDSCDVTGTIPGGKSVFND